MENGIRLDIAGGINTVSSPDQIEANGGGYPYLQNVRKNRKSMTVARFPLGSNLLTSVLANGITSISRLNDPYKATPSYAYLSGSNGSLYVGNTQVASGLSTLPLSFLPYRPPDSPQPWDYIADPSLAVNILNPSYTAYGPVCGMLKVRSDGTCYKMGIKEPQTAPIVNVESAASPYWVTYRYLYRSKITGALSNPSPESVPIQVQLVSVPGTYTMDSSYASHISFNTSQYETAVSNTQLRTSGISAGTLTDYIIAKDLPGLAGASIPTGAQITGVSVSITWNGQQNGTGVLSNVALFYQGAVIGQIKSPGTINTQTVQTTLQGGASDVWGAILTPDVVTDSTFGFGVQVLTEESGGTDRSFFYVFTITVYYANFSATGSCTLSIDPQVDTIDVYRQTPGLDNFTYTLSIANSGSGSFNDTLADLTIANNPILSYNNYEPFPSIDLPRSGTCNVLGVSQEVTAVGTVNPGSGQTPGTHPIASVGGGGTGAVVTVVIDSTGIISTSTPPVVTAMGSGYTSVPTFPLTFGGTPGTVSATISPILPLLPNVQWVSGDIFNVRWLPGTAVLIADSTGSQIGYLLYNRPSDTTHMLVYNTTVTDTGFITFSFPPAGTGLTWQIIAPDLAAEPSPVIWGPTPDSGGGSFMMGLDPLNPGDLLTSLGNNFDSAPSSQRLYICSPSEGLQNGIVTSELHVVFSPERFWLLYPNFSDAVATVTGTTGPLWTPVQAAATRGLFMRYALGGLGALIAWRAKDGIFISQAGGPEQDISANIYNLFPHGEPEGPSPVVIGNQTIYPPNDAIPQAQTITCVPGYIFYNYQDINGTPRTLVFDMEAKGWVVDSYTPTVNCHALATGVNQILCGCSDGTIRAFDTAGGEVATAVVSTPCINGGNLRAQKRLGDVLVKATVAADNPMAVGLYANLYSTALSGYSPTSLTGTGASSSYVIDFTSGNGSDLLDIAAQISWPIGGGNILEWWAPYWAQLLPDSINDRPTTWMDLGSPGSNYVRGMVLEADTFNVAKNFSVEDEFGNLHSPQESPVTLNGQQKIGLSFNPPFVSHIGRIISSDGVAWRRAPDENWSIQWISDPYPEITKAYTPIMELGGPDNKFMQGVKLIADTGNTPVTFQVLFDGGQTGPTFTGAFNGKQTLVFSWTPFEAHDIQLIPQGNARIWYGGVGQGQSEWVFEPYPEKAAIWTTELTALGGRGWQSLFYINVEYSSTAAITLKFAVDAGNNSLAPQSITLPSTGGVQTKAFFSMTPNKWKLLSFSATSTAPFYSFAEGMEAWVSSWGVGIRNIKPFGGDSSGGTKV